MRLCLLCVAVAAAVAAGMSIAQDDRLEPSGSLVDLLYNEGVIAYRIDSKTAVYEIQLISTDVVDASREYYAKRQVRLEEYRELEKQHDSIKKRLQLAQLANGGTAVVTQSDKDAMGKLERQMAKVSRPTGYYRVGEITRRGSDFIGLRELDSRLEYLVPIARIKHVIATRSEQATTKP